ncbi:hypothetical protein H311_01914 [Anncaliia algerae PRA109]|nr:hypothetical protein H311_01914 [Anncaliia algerae PRA109]
MIIPSDLEEIIIKMDKSNFINFLMQNSFIKKEVRCSFCNVFMILAKYKKNQDGVAWRCINSDCAYFKEYFSIRISSFFEGFTCEISFILRVLIKYLTRQQISSITLFFRRNKSLILKIIKMFKERIPETDFSSNKLGGPGAIVQIDETMLNYKCKSHRGRSSENKTDSISIVECTNGIVRAFAKIIPNKESRTLLPIIASQVARSSIIYTDEHRSYCKLNELGFVHKTVCHKKEFVNYDTGVNTQAVEAFHNSLKYEIKKKKGVFTKDRALFFFQ